MLDSSPRASPHHSRILRSPDGAGSDKESTRRGYLCRRRLRFPTSWLRLCRVGIGTQMTSRYGPLSRSERRHLFFVRRLSHRPRRRPSPSSRRPTLPESLEVVGGVSRRKPLQHLAFPDCRKRGQHLAAKSKDRPNLARRCERLAPRPLPARRGASDGSLRAGLVRVIARLEGRLYFDGEPAANDPREADDAESRAYLRQLSLLRELARRHDPAAAATPRQPVFVLPRSRRQILATILALAARKPGSSRRRRPSPSPSPSRSPSSSA